MNGKGSSTRSTVNPATSFPRISYSSSQELIKWTDWLNLSQCDLLINFHDIIFYIGLQFTRSHMPKICTKTGNVCILLIGICKTNFSHVKLHFLMKVSRFNHDNLVSAEISLNRSIAL